MVAPPPIPKEPEPKKQRLDDSLLVPEDQFLAQHQGLGLDLDRPYSFVIAYYASQRSKEDDVQKISTSVFVTNFPDGYSTKDLWNTCKLYGHVVDVFIPDKRTKAGYDSVSR
nr:nucleotide-binding alpha-beta plait domain-containing protein [Tanacetum cinerariifolium]